MRTKEFWLGVLAGVACTFLGLVLAIAISTSRQGQPSSAQGGPIETAVCQKAQVIGAYLDARYLDIDEVDTTELGDIVAYALLKGTGDAYANYYSAEDARYALMGIIDGDDPLCGIGVLVTQDPDSGKITVESLVAGAGAEAAGVQVGDILVSVDGHEGFDQLSDIDPYILGKEGTTVDIVVERDGEKINLSVERVSGWNPTVRSHMLDDGVGYLRITSFDTTTPGEFQEQLQELIDQGMTSLVLDLRFNLGGEYDSVVAIADRLLPEGTIFQTKDAAGNVQTETSDEENRLDMPIAVLVNRYTASASELLSGALQDHGRAVIVGEVTYGKGVVQSLYGLSDGSYIKFTTEEYYLPDGECIQGTGITPDVELGDDVIDSDEAIDAAVAALRE